MIFEQYGIQTFISFQWGITELADNFTVEKYYYLITVQTGLRINAGTKSNISFGIVGDRASTGLRQLSDGYRVSNYERAQEQNGYISRWE